MSRRIVIVGGGVVGCSVAWHLADAGTGAGEIVLLEREQVGSGTTWHSAGNITWRPAPSHHDSSVLYAFDIIARLERETGQSTGWLENGRLFLAKDAETIQTYESYHRDATSRGIGGRILSREEAGRLHPLLDPSSAAFFWLNPLSGRVNPADLTAAYARGARQRGVRVVENCRVTGLEIHSGRIVGVCTSTGPIAANVVVVAGGLWSRLLLAASGIALPQWSVEHFYVIADVTPRLAASTPSFEMPERGIYGREEAGGMLVGFVDENAKTIDEAALPDPFAFTLLNSDWDKIAPYFQSAMESFPILGDAPIRRFINGPEAFTPDGSPLIGPWPDVEGLFLCTGMNSEGVTRSAMAGRLTAELITDVKPSFDTSHCAPARFGSRAADTAWLQRKVSQHSLHAYAGKAGLPK
ncbi:FAD-binding oxidoreductase [Mesorhizobium sp. M1005]|uniref:NAD(P)/FAD-dependent oxidoreductase n=1 Tax=unclassified Mesorhizobium TaxID=325217 RepID=UPI003337936C